MVFSGVRALRVPRARAATSSTRAAVYAVAGCNSHRLRFVFRANGDKHDLRGHPSRDNHGGTDRRSGGARARVLALSRVHLGPELRLRVWRSPVAPKALPPAERNQNNGILGAFRIS